MDHEDTAARSDQPRQASQLTELLACEQELAELLDEARREARGLVEAARAETEQAVAELEASLEEEAQRERERIRAETQRRVRELVALARERTERFEQVSEERVDALAEAAFRRLVSGGVEP